MDDTAVLEMEWFVIAANMILPTENNGVLVCNILANGRRHLVSTLLVTRVGSSNPMIFTTVKTPMGQIPAFPIALLLHLMVERERMDLQEPVA